MQRTSDRSAHFVREADDREVDDREADDREADDREADDREADDREADVLSRFAPYNVSIFV